MRRLLETRLEANRKKEAEKIKKHGKKNRRIGNCEKTIVEDKLDEGSW